MATRQLTGGNRAPGIVGQMYGALDGMWLESYGQLHTDIYDLSSATAVWVSPADRMVYPLMGSVHPIWGFLSMERRTVSVEYGYCRCTGEYAGFEGKPQEVVEWSSGVSEEPIQTHPKFANFAGRPSAPLNGAIFIDFETGAKTTDDSRGVFEKFWSNPPNSFAGVTSYLVPVLVKRSTQVASQPTAYTSQVGKLNFGMLCTNVTINRRGRVYQTTVEYRGAGPRGWNTSIY